MPKLKMADFIGSGEHCHVAAPVLSVLKPAASHTHDFLEVFWCDRGHGGHWINGDRRELTPGTLVFVRADDEHAFTGSAEMPLRIVNIAFACETWKFLRDRYGGDDRDLYAPGDAETRERRLSPAQMAELARHAAELRSGARSREAIERFLLNLMQLVRQIDTAQPMAELPAWLDRARREIASPEHFAAGTMGLAERAGKSPEHVARAVRRYLGTTPTALVNEARMIHAAERLTTTADDILDVCADCGFENLSHFYALFRKRWGVSPKRYRQQQQTIVRP